MEMTSFASEELLWGPELVSIDRYTKTRFIPISRLELRSLERKHECTVGDID